MLLNYEKRKKKIKKLGTFPINLKWLWKVNEKGMKFWGEKMLLQEEEWDVQGDKGAEADRNDVITKSRIKPN